MRFILAAKIAYKNIYSNWLRTVLSLIGIIIGVVSIIVVLSLGGGMRAYVGSQIQAFGDDFIEIEVKTPQTSKTSAQNAQGFVGGGQVTTFKLEDAEEVAKLSNVESWYAAILNQNVVSYRENKKQTFIMGSTPGIVDVDKQMKIESGRMFNQEDEVGGKQVVVLGHGVKEEFFSDDGAVGKKIKIKGQAYKVIGVFEERGVAGFFDWDDVMYMPLSTLQKKIMGIDFIQFSIFNLKNVDLMEFTRLQAESIMRDRHDTENLEDDDFAVSSITEVQDILDQVFFVIDALLLAVASVSLMVGGVGIMNVMYVAVTERTYEIGLRKSLGARNSTILVQFLVESIILTFLGGLIGLVLSLLINELASYASTQVGFEIQFVPSLWAIALGVGFSAVTGLIFGYYPARKASKITPMQALRKR